MILSKVARGSVISKLSNSAGLLDPLPSSTLHLPRVPAFRGLLFSRARASRSTRRRALSEAARSMERFWGPACGKQSMEALLEEPGSTPMVPKLSYRPVILVDSCTCTGLPLASESSSTVTVACKCSSGAASAGDVSCATTNSSGLSIAASASQERRCVALANMASDSGGGPWESFEQAGAGTARAGGSPPQHIKRSRQSMLRMRTHVPPSVRGRTGS
mmetsp:Transcript_93599/g.274132  ORF Transcript_93599/g.274132 Transcript_93599/m.274132 type:complete len:218 (+) Transcript_93599:1946-2599(+)